ncbi:aminopeptidase [Macrococcus brunensis]|uniref:Aminopeptidase n=1 Tax=Macrococcus brunensis TaxID=198483 RepID=A0A4R6BEL8_9STAP|nr:aminopeptidase [Macrococcus brunensis]TDL98254.1 aminopeptidase [Macrococcus brunensis]ULG71609.1 aminopeptidase [Macrococcus brunensis]ULG73872.1 aminopeptidase [Macrococcus brunensis]
MDYIEKLKKYAELVVKVGLNVQKGQKVSISADIDAIDFVRAVTKAAYEVGAVEVIQDLTDGPSTQMKYEYAPIETFKKTYEYQKQRIDTHLEERVAHLRIYSQTPELLKNADPEKIAANATALGELNKDFARAVGRFDFSWCIVAFPNVAWAELVFPDLKGEEARTKLLDAMIAAVRADQADPVLAWEEHNRNLNARARLLTEKGFDRLHYKSERTDVEIGLNQHHIWMGASAVNAEGVEIQVNMPTEEVFTSPDFRRVNGIIGNTRPLSYNSAIIDDFKLTFKDGSVTDFEAGVGYDVLKNMLETDAGARRLGEIALVPDDSPISNSGILYYNTLFDENASCHVALGRSFPGALKEGKALSKEDLEAHGLNQSLIHVDFMIGGPDLSIEGIHKDGTKEFIFKDGNWVI